MPTFSASTRAAVVGAGLFAIGVSALYRDAFGSWRDRRKEERRQERKEARKQVYAAGTEVKDAAIAVMKAKRRQLQNVKAKGTRDDDRADS